MSMPLGFSIKVSLFSMRRRLIRTVLSLIPGIALIAVMFIGSTIPNGIVTELDNQILKNAEARQEIVMLDPFVFNQPSFGGSNGSMPAMEFNQKNYDIVTQAPQVKEVYPQYGQVSGKAAEIGNIKNAPLTVLGSSQEFAKLYTDKPFTYQPGQPIPVLINPSVIGSQEYNWNGKDTLNIDYSDQEKMQESMIYQTLENPEQLVGKTFMGSFGAFPQYPEAFEEMTGKGFGPPEVKITKLNDDDRAILDKRINEIYSPYWNVESLKTPLEYEFIVVGLLQGEGGTDQGYIPSEGTVAILNDLHSRQSGARTPKTLDDEFLSKESGKIELTNNFLSVNEFESYQSPTWQKDSSVSAWQVQMQGVSIPGLIVEATKNARGENQYKEVTLPQITSDNFRATSATVRLHSPDDREGYIKYLGDNNIPFFDNSPLGVIRMIREGSQTFVTWLTIILGAIVALILATTVSRFVADSRREIGVWRAIGATKIDIVKLILTRTSLLLLICIGIGIMLGFGLSVLIANQLADQFAQSTDGFNPYASQGFISMIVISMLGGIVPEISAASLLATDWSLLGSRLALLTAITVLIGLIPAWRASRISPVTAIRDSE